MSTDKIPSTMPGLTLKSEEGPKQYIFENDYELLNKLRSGSYGTVYTTKQKATNQEYAVKVIDRTKLKPKDDEGVFREVKIMKELLDVQNIVQLIDFYEEPQTFYVVQFFAQGGDVFDKLAKRTSYTEGDARDLAVKLLKTMEALHERRICHRDMKPENLLLSNRHDDTSILLADFGFAKHVPEDGLKTRCGTPAFVAPEILVGSRYNMQVDMWSVGCLLYMLIGGYPPFQDESHRGLFRKIRAADFTFHDMYWRNVSIHAKQLISKLLTVDPVLRLDAKAALTTTWLEINKENLSSRDLSSSISELKKFNAKRTFKSAINVVLWSVGNPFRHEKVSDLNQATDKFDAKNSKNIMDTSQKTEFSLSKIHRKKFTEVYELGEKIHRGSFAVVKQCYHKDWKQKYAVKIIQRGGSKKTLSDEAVLHEVAIMNQLDHPHIVKVVDFFEEDDYYYIVMELMEGGDVFDRIVDMNQYTEKDARDLAKIMLEAIDYMHTSGVAHRDIKPQNLLLKSKGDNATIKIADFGFARRVHTPKSLNSRCGTPSYVAPEILKNQPYDQCCDMWSCGVVLYVMLCGYTPFMEENQEKMFERIKHGDWKFDENDWSHVSKEAKNLITMMLEPNPDARISAARALRSKWINEDATSLSSRDLSQSVIHMRQDKPKLKDLARAFMALGTLKKALDTGSSGMKNAGSNVVPTQGEDGSHQLL